MFCGCFMDWLIVFIAKVFKEPKLANAKIVSCYNGAFETKWFSKLLEFFCMNYKIFKMKIKILINPWKSIFFCWLVVWIELDSSGASLFELRFARAFVVVGWKFWNIGLFWWITGFGKAHFTGETISKLF